MPLPLLNLPIFASELILENLDFDTKFHLSILSKRARRLVRKYIPKNHYSVRITNNHQFEIIGNGWPIMELNTNEFRMVLAANWHILKHILVPSKDWNRDSGDVIKTYGSWNQMKCEMIKFLCEFLPDPRIFFIFNQRGIIEDAIGILSTPDPLNYDKFWSEITGIPVEDLNRVSMNFKSLTIQREPFSRNQLIQFFTGWQQGNSKLEEVGLEYKTETFPKIVNQLGAVRVERRMMPAGIGAFPNGRCYSIRQENGTEAYLFKPLHRDCIRLSTVQLPDYL